MATKKAKSGSKKTAQAKQQPHDMRWHDMSGKEAIPVNSVEAKDDLGPIARIFPIDYAKLQGSLQNGRDNAVTTFSVREGDESALSFSSEVDSLVIATHLLINGSPVNTMVPLQHGRELVRRLTDLLDRAQAEGLDVG